MHPLEDFSPDFVIYDLSYESQKYLQFLPSINRTISVCYFYLKGGRNVTEDELWDAYVSEH